MRASGEIGRRTSLRCWRAKAHGSSSLLSRTNFYRIGGPEKGLIEWFSVFKNLREDAGFFLGNAFGVPALPSAEDFRRVRRDSTERAWPVPRRR